MFGFLKKKIKESIDNITKAVSKKPDEAEKIKDEFRPEYQELKNDDLSVPVGDEINRDVPKETSSAVEIEKAIPLEKPVPQEEIIGIDSKPAEIKSDERPKKAGFLENITKKFTKKVTEVKIREEDVSTIIDDLKMGLMENDVALDVAEKICEDVEKSLVGKSVKRSKVGDIAKDSLRKSVSDILSQKKINLREFVTANDKPGLLLFVGFNGAGKTTTLARIGNYLKAGGVSCVFAAGDSFRAASIEQLQVHGDRLGIKVIKHNYGADSAAVIYDSMKYATTHNIDVVLADTAGRTHVNANLIDELKKVCRVNNPSMKILVLDSLTGNDIVEQAQKFDEAVGIDAVVFTKVDVYEKGGAILSATHTIKKPILFLGIGQGYEDIEEFNADSIVNRLFS
ncbi:MAG: signal recognition particle-docking protein FtsY [Candidatus Aenigmarchaeota archaeon]|nr:signal recognition particle-docking protein FtsY [Candidatus Aenigmarchaeota archaeon]